MTQQAQCNHCGSGNVSEELMVSDPPKVTYKLVKYQASRARVCLDCGHTDLFLSSDMLEELKKKYG